MYEFYYTLSIIDRVEVMVDADLSSSDSDSKSVMEIFNSFPGVSQQPQQLPPHQAQQQRRLERPPSSLSESTNRTRLSSVGGCVVNAPRRQNALGGFVHTGSGRTGIRSASHATGLIGLIQLAGAHPSGLIGTLGHNNRTSWFQDNTEAIFQADGPLGMFRSVLPAVLARHFAVASIQARDIYDCNHSVDQSGAAHEDVPPWA
jgi:hypothetical protein